MSLRHGLLFGLGIALVAGTPSLAASAPPGDTDRGKPPSSAGRAVVAQGRTQAGKPPSLAPAGGAVARDPNVPHTLAEALTQTYLYLPTLQAERAKLRATDENVPQALAGWRPTVVLSGTAGYGDGVTRTYLGGGTGYRNVQTDRVIGTATATVTQNLYTGGRIQANVNRSLNQVMAERATLIAQEQTSFVNAVNAYVGVIQSRQLLALNINNEQVLAKQLQATNDRFRVGEITRTDVAQAEAALAQARAVRNTAEGSLQTARGTFQQVIGILPPDDLVEPQPLRLPVNSELDASTAAATNNPNVITALFNDAAAKDAVDAAFAALLPQASVQGEALQQTNVGGRSISNNGYQVLAQISVPIYQGGSEYATVRQTRQQQLQTARQVDEARRLAVQNAISAWSTLAGARAAADSTRAAIRANEIALEGVEREAIVGSRTTLDVLNATQSLLNARTNLVQNLSQLLTASYQVAAAIGRLTARDLQLKVPLYDETAYFTAVRNRWAGLGDYAKDQPGR